MAMRATAIGVTAGMTVVLAAIAAQPQRSRSAGDWVSYGGTNWSQKYSPLDQINRDNFKTLKVVWTWRSPDVEIVKRIGTTINPPLNATGLKGTPLVVNGLIYRLVTAQSGARLRHQPMVWLEQIASSSLRVGAPVHE